MRTTSACTASFEFVVWTVSLSLNGIPAVQSLHLPSLEASASKLCQFSGLDLLAIHSFSEGLARDYLIKASPNLTGYTYPSLDKQPSDTSTYLELDLAKLSIEPTALTTELRPRG